MPKKRKVSVPLGVRVCDTCGYARPGGEFGSDYPTTCGRCVAHKMMGREEKPS